MNGTIISEEKLLELKDLAKIIEDNSLPFPALSVEIQEHEKREVKKATDKILKLINEL